MLLEKGLTSATLLTPSKRREVAEAFNSKVLELQRTNTERAAEVGCDAVRLP
jgi:hypothetical protein